MHTNAQRGIAIVLALFLMSAMSVLAASLMFLAQTETYASMNYKMMSQARYAAEGAIQKASNFLLDPTQYQPPGSVSDPLANYNRTVSPVTYNGQPVILSAVASQASNYPSAAVKTAFNAAAQGSLTADTATLGYGAYATLVTMQVFDSYGGGQAVVQTWLVTGNGTVPGARTGTVQVSAMIDTPKVPANSYAAFAMATTCGAMSFHGNTTINSYDSTTLASGSSPTMQSSGGDVGTNGNLDIQGSVDVQGNLYSPRTGVGSCTAGAVDALTAIGSAVIGGSVLQLPAALAYPPPVFSATPPTMTVTVDNSFWGLSPAAACANMGLSSGVNCTVNTAAKTLTVNGNGTDVTLPSVNMSTGTLIFVGHSPQAANININSLTGNGGNIQFQTNAGATDIGDSVVLKVAGKNPDGTDMTTPIDLSAIGWSQNSNFKYDASSLQIDYGGTGTISMTGNSQAAATIYAPNSNFSLLGTADLYGSILANTVTIGGNADIHYDRKLSKDYWVAGHAMASTFNWLRY